MALLTGSNKIKTAVFISGTGSNLKSLIKFSKLKKSPIIIKLIISNNNKAKGLQYKWENIPKPVSTDCLVRIRQFGYGEKPKLIPEVDYSASKWWKVLHCIIHTIVVMVFDAHKFL